jgi:DNA replication protein DnaC
MDMVNQLMAAEADHSLVKKLTYYQSPDLLIIDEIGYLPLGSHGSNLFFQIISSRHQNKSSVITTNLLCGAPHNKFNAEFIIMR